MTKKDILELKRRFTKEDCTFTRMCGCYVNGNREQVLKFGETFLNVEDEEFYKYLEIAKKTLSGTIGNNLLKLEFPKEEEFGGRQQFLMGLRESKLKNDDLLDRFYEMIINHYDYVGNYLILVFHDVYDVITKTNDNLKIDESEEVYEYLLCAICPVVLSKPGLGYREDENRIGARIRDWVVSAPDAGFLFPAFSDRSADTHAVTYYIRDAKDSHAEFAEGALGCGAKLTATEQKQTFHAIIKHALGPDEEKTDELLLEVQENLDNKLREQEEMATSDDEEYILSSAEITDVLVDSGIPENIAREITHSYEEEFHDEPPMVKNLIDEKAIENNQKVKRERELVKQVNDLQQALIEKSFADEETEDGDYRPKTYDVIVRVKPEKASRIKSQMIGDQKYLVIPMEENEYVNLNGINTQV